MRILVLAPQWPDPPRQGAAIRNLHILLYLAQRHQVTLLTFAPEGDPVDMSRLKALHHSEILPLPTRSPLERLRTLLTSNQPDMAWRLRSDRMWERMREVCTQQQFDAVHIEGIEMAPYGLLAATIQSPMLTYDAHNAEYLLQRRAFTTDVARLGNLPKALYSLVQWWRLRRFERQVCLGSKHVLAVSGADKAALGHLAPQVADRTTVLPNGVDTEYWSLSAGYPDPPPITECALVFDGTMDFRPNVDAVLWFASEIWPLVRAAQPEARFFIVGRNPTAQVSALANTPGVTVTGAVDDPRPWVAQATMYVVPMRMGGGVRLKVLQAMSMERAIVSTPVGAEGISAQHGRELLLARSPQAFTEAILTLLDNPGKRTELGRAARQLVAAHYAWPVLLPTLDAVYPI